MTVLGLDNVMFEPRPLGIGMMVMMPTVLIAAWTDWQSRRVPNALLGCSALVALGFAVFAPSGIGIQASLLGGLAGLLLFMPFYLMHGMAAGDVKLLAVLGMYAGPMRVFEIALVSALVGGAWAVVALARSRRAGVAAESQEGEHPSAARWRVRAPRGLPDEPLQKTAATRNHAIPYAVVMAIGTLLVVFASFA